MYGPKFGTLKTGRLIEGGRLIQGRYIQVPLYKHMAGYKTFVKSPGITFEWRINKDSKKLEYRDFTGPEKLVLIQNINFKSLLPNCHVTEDLQVLWSSFMDIIGDLKLDYTTDEAIANLEVKIENWFEKFLALYQAKDVTPYMHALYAHVPEFVQSLAIQLKHVLQNVTIVMPQLSLHILLK